MKTHVPARLLPFAFSVLTLVPALASAQTTSTTDRAPVRPAHPALAFGSSGKFKSTDGTTGTFRETETLYDANASSTVSLVYTRASDGATRLEQTDYLTNADGTHTRNFTLTDYGASSSFTSSQTITSLGRGQSVGQGRYTTADGVSGTVTSLETTSAVGVDVLTQVYSSPATGVSTEQRTTTSPVNVPIAKLETVNGQIALITPNVHDILLANGITLSTGTTTFATFAIPVHKTVIKSVTVDASGQTTNTVQARTFSGEVGPLSILP